MAADQVDRDFPQQREILDGVPIPHPAVIFLEGDVENPVQAILNLPVPAHRCCQDLRGIGAAGQKIADVGFGLTRPIDMMDGFHSQDGLQAGPVAQRFQPGSIRADEHAAPNQAAVAIIKFVMDRPVERRAAEQVVAQSSWTAVNFFPWLALSTTR